VTAKRRTSTSRQLPLGSSGNDGCTWRHFAETLHDCGWALLTALARSGEGRKLIALREAASDEFGRLMGTGALASTPVMSSGQAGLTGHADEGEVGLVEERGHLVFNQGLPADHPLAQYQPAFYGADLPLPQAAGRLQSMAEPLHEVLDALTLRSFEAIEDRMGLARGTLAAPLAMGERLLRFQWYPALSTGGRRDVFEVRTEAGIVPIAGQQIGGRRLVRASPHKDMGHWTWQVHATDSSLRFWDAESSVPTAVDQEGAICGNVCEFLELHAPPLKAPIHWVDTLDGTIPRVSISYFAHTRPGVPVGTAPAGVLLYERLRDLGYVTSEEVGAVTAMLARPELEDAVLVARILEWERSHAADTAGFASGLSRYYTDEGLLMKRMASGPCIAD
jgi:isopenicillin N synthase-like dioxygenase